MPSCNTYHLTLDVGYLFTAAQATTAAAPYLGRPLKQSPVGAEVWALGFFSSPAAPPAQPWDTLTSSSLSTSPASLNLSSISQALPSRSPIKPHQYFSDPRVLSRPRLPPPQRMATSIRSGPEAAFGTPLQTGSLRGQGFKSPPEAPRHPSLSLEGAAPGSLEPRLRLSHARGWAEGGPGCPYHEGARPAAKTQGARVRAVTPFFASLVACWTLCLENPRGSE